MFPQTDNYVLFESFQIWTSVPWMTSWSTPVVHVNKYIPKGSNQLIEEYIGRLLLFHPYQMNKSLKHFCQLKQLG